MLLQIGKQFVVSTVDQIQNGLSPEFLKPLLTHPAAIDASHLQQLELLVQTYPQCSVFHLLLAKAAQKSEPAVAARALQSAAVQVADREVLFRLIHQPELLIAPKQDKIYPFVSIPSTETNASFIHKKSENEVVVSEEITSAELIDTSFTEEKQATEKAADTSFIDPNPKEAIAAENDLRVEDVNLNFANKADGELVFPAEEESFPSEEIINIREAALAVQEIDEEVYDEIMAIEDINFEVIKEASPEMQPETKPEILVEEAPLLTARDKAEKDMLSSIASIDYFTFNNKFGKNQTPVIEGKPTEKNTEEETESIDAQITPEKQNELPPEKEPETVSKYHDDKMPYTFMWWLDKTRKEYAETYRPYVKNTQKAESGLSVGPELHQQYIESIFHTKAPHEVAEDRPLPAVGFPVKRKENQLIERFIIEEPHIHPPSADRLDTENKAKRSSEDADILVTETLAKVYLDQMLYYKALDTYKKLMLKFPEKSLYFAGQIESIEKKIN